MIEAFHRNLKYFEDKILQSDKTIKANDFDGQFNDITQYLNTTLKPEIDDLINAALKGKAGNVGQYLHNIGDGNTFWSLLDDSTIDDYSISLDKLVQQNIGSILATNTDGEITTIVISPATDVLVSKVGDMPIFQSLGSNDIGNEILTGKQFDILLAENFVANTFVEEFVPNEIITDEIQDLAITNNKIKDGIIGETQLGVFTNLPPAPTVGNLRTTKYITDGAITDDKIQDYSIPVTFRGSTVGGYELWAEEYGTAKDLYNYTYKQLLKSENILDNSIDDDQLRSIKLTGQVVEVDNTGLFSDIPVSFQFQENHIALDSIELEYFDSEVQIAINKVISG